MNRDLFLTILSMASYNRGYDFQIRELSESGRLGGATLLAATEEQQANWQNVGFYAIAYEYQGETIIAYRGSDDRTTDVVFGYGTAAGFAYGVQAAQSSPRLCVARWSMKGGRSPAGMDGELRLFGRS